MTNFLSFASTVSPFSVRRWIFRQQVLVDANNAPMGLRATENGPDGIWGPVDLSAAQIASPTAAMIADLYANYRLNVAPYTRYRSDGTTLQMVPSTGDSPKYAALAASTTYANDAAAAVGGVPVGAFYRNGSVVQIRVS